MIAVALFAWAVMSVAFGLLAGAFIRFGTGEAAAGDRPLEPLHATDRVVLLMDGDTVMLVRVAP